MYWLRHDLMKLLELAALPPLLPRVQLNDTIYLCLAIGIKRRIEPNLYNLIIALPAPWLPCMLLSFILCLLPPHLCCALLWLVTAEPGL